MNKMKSPFTGETEHTEVQIIYDISKEHHINPSYLYIFKELYFIRAADKKNNTKVYQNICKQIMMVTGLQHKQLQTILSAYVNNYDEKTNKLSKYIFLNEVCELSMLIEASIIFNKNTAQIANLINTMRCWHEG